MNSLFFFNDCLLSSLPVFFHRSKYLFSSLLTIFDPFHAPYVCALLCITYVLFRSYIALREVETGESEVGMTAEAAQSPTLIGNTAILEKSTDVDYMSVVDGELEGGEKAGHGMEERDAKNEEKEIGKEGVRVGNMGLHASWMGRRCASKRVREFAEPFLRRRGEFVVHPTMVQGEYILSVKGLVRGGR